MRTLFRPFLSLSLSLLSLPLAKSMIVPKIKLRQVSQLALLACFFLLLDSSSMAELDPEDDSYLRIIDGEDTPIGMVELKRRDDPEREMIILKER